MYRISYISFRKPQIIKFNKFFEKILKIKKRIHTTRTIIIKMNEKVLKISKVLEESI